MIDPYKKKALNRLNRARGQIDGITKMIVREDYCIDILTQLLALEGAVGRVHPIILGSHLNSCGEHLASKNLKKRQQFIKELVRTCDLSNR